MALTNLQKQAVEAIMNAFCEKRVPLEVRDKINLSFEINGCKVNLYENRPFWRDPSQWSKMKIAQFRFNNEDRKWTLYCLDRNQKYWEYDHISPNKDIKKLIEEVDADPTGIFWG